MARIKVLNVVGARPNFMKMAPIVAAMQRRHGRFEQRLVHTGQHYDVRMSGAFFDDLGLPRPDVELGVGSGSHAEQTGRVMIAIEKVCIAERPDLVLVVGDVNSTLAAAVAARKLGIAVAHVEAGLRSDDLGMPEEINRRCTDAVSDRLFTTDRFADQNLRREGVQPERIHRVGNVMIDTLERHRAEAARLTLPADLGLAPGGFALLTLHRPANVDDRAALARLVETLALVARRLPIIFPVHPRTLRRIAEFGLSRHLASGPRPNGLWAMEPLGYLELLSLHAQARFIATDSGGLQEESTVLGIPCLTLRDTTERPITVVEGTSRLVGTDRERILAAAEDAIAGRWPPGRIPELWDGHAAQRIVAVLAGDRSSAL